MSSDRKIISVHLSSKIIPYLDSVAKNDDGIFVSRSSIINRILATEFAKGTDYVKQLIYPSYNESKLVLESNELESVRLVQ